MELYAILELSILLFAALQIISTLNSLKKQKELVSDLKSLLTDVFDYSTNIILVSPSGKILLPIAPKDSVLSSIESSLISIMISKYESSSSVTEIQINGLPFFLSISKEKYFSETAYLLKLVATQKDNSELEKNKIELLRTVTHELRTPASSIINLTSMISTYSLPSPCIENLNMIYSSSQYMLCLINDLLDYSQLRDGALKIRKSSFNLRYFLSEVVELIRCQATLKSLKLSFSLSENLPSMIYTDPFRLKQILLNLLNNAIKFTSTGSIEILVIRLDKSAKFTCKDTGVGIDIEKIDFLCNKYFTDEDVRHYNPQGAGLGLYISNMLSRQLGSNGISVESSIGKGSEFSFLIDLESIEEAITFSEEIPEEVCNVHLPDSPPINTLIKPPRFKRQGTRRLTEIIYHHQVLIADDNNFSSMIFNKILLSEGYQTKIVYNGEEAVKEVKEHDGRYECVLIDCEMPIMDGWTAVNKLRNLKANRDIKYLPAFLGTTAYCDEEVSRKCFECGMDDLVLKPSSKIELLQKIDTCIKLYLLNAKG